jgi:hypothetical protein
VEAVRERLNEDLALLGIAACRVDARTRHAIEVVGICSTRSDDGLAP